jgi:hypothetical protein
MRGFGSLGKWSWRAGINRLFCLFLNGELSYFAIEKLASTKAMGYVGVHEMADRRPCAKGIRHHH